MTLDSQLFAPEDDEEDDDPYAIELSLHETGMSEDNDSSKHRTTITLLQCRIDLISKNLISGSSTYSVRCTLYGTISHNHIIIITHSELINV